MLASLALVFLARSLTGALYGHAQQVLAMSSMLNIDAYGRDITRDRIRQLGSVHMTRLLTHWHDGRE
jgi:hypothetical protein